MTYSRILFLLLTLPGISLGAELTVAHNTLSNWGLAYCINAVSTEKPINNEAQRTMGAYFERGRHDDENAYEEVRKYFSRELSKKKLVDKNSGKPMAFVTCMHLVQTEGFRRLIIMQDKHVQIDRKEK